MLYALAHAARCQTESRKGLDHAIASGCVSRPQPALARRLGADAGCDTIGDARQGPGLLRFFSVLADEGSLGRTVLYNINPANNALFAGMSGSFQDGTIAGKIQWGAAWWFMDQERGMREQINTLSDIGLLSGFIGMVTDSRSFLSYPRHEYFRRILCDMIGKDVETGRLPDRARLARRAYHRCLLHQRSQILLLKSHALFVRKIPFKSVYLFSRSLEVN